MVQKGKCIVHITTTPISLTALTTYPFEILDNKGLSEKYSLPISVLNEVRWLQQIGQVAQAAVYSTPSTFKLFTFRFDCYGGLSKINTPLLMPLQLSLDDWSINPANEIYGLFAVVMHSGITISSGHYTASVKVTDLDSLELEKENFLSDPLCEICPEPLTEQEARAMTEDYDDGEVSFRVGSVQSNIGVSKKNIEPVGLLGGQKSKPNYDMPSSKLIHSDKIASMITDGRNSEHSHTKGVTEFEHCNQTDTASNELENQAVHIMQSLKKYEGKWLLFDDSEVKVTEEKDFLDSLSPVSLSTSTPYLLFYKKIVA